MARAHRASRVDASLSIYHCRPRLFSSVDNQPRNTGDHHRWAVSSSLTDFSPANSKERFQISEKLCRSESPFQPGDACALVTGDSGSPLLAESPPSSLNGFSSHSTMFSSEIVMWHIQVLFSEEQKRRAKRDREGIKEKTPSAKGMVARSSVGLERKIESVSMCQ